MPRLATVILIAVGIFILLVGSALVMRNRAIRMEAADPVASTADYRIKEVRLEEDAGAVRWRLVAEQAEIFDAEGRTGLRRPVVDIREASRAWTVRGDEGEIWQATKNLEVRRNVVLESGDGLRLETSRLRWDATAKRLWTDAPVVITREGTVIRGSGLDVRVEEEHAEVKGRVRAAFSGMPRPIR